MPFADHDDVVKALPSNRANHSLGICVLPRLAGRNDHFADVQRLGLTRKPFSINLVSVPDQIPGRLFAHARLQQLPRRQPLVPRPPDRQGPARTPKPRRCS